MTEYNYSNFTCPCHLQQSAISRPLSRPRPSSKTALSFSSKQENRVSGKLRWRLGEETPKHFHRFYYNTVATHENTVYISDNYCSRIIYAYDASRSTECWSQLPSHPNVMCSLAVINNLLTTIGGEVEHTVTNKLFSFTDGDECWTEKFPPMPTKRRDTAALCTGTSLIVAGGIGVTSYLSTVEVMNTDTLQWSSAADLPHPISLWRDGSLTLCGEQLFITCGDKLYQCELTSLLQSCQSTTSTSSHTAHVASTIWKKISDLHVTVLGATCVSLNGHLLAIGGHSRSASPSQTAVRMYDLATNSWTIISHMSIARSYCFAAVLPDNQLVVVGGFRNPFHTHTYVNTVEIATFI